MKSIRRIEHVPCHRATCQHCHQRIIEVPDVGWLDPDAGDTYDLCPVDSFGNHQPGPVDLTSATLAAT